MYGFNIIQAGKGSGIASRVIKEDNIICEDHMIRKFENDKIFYQDSRYIIILDGVVFNKQELMGGVILGQLH